MNGPSARGGCAPTEELLAELALGILGGAERAEVLAHLDRCASCRDESAGWATTADALPTLLAEAEPPAGFEARTLERLRAQQTLVPRRSLLRRIFNLAAIVAMVTIATLATVRIVDATRDEGRPADRSAGGDVTKATMVGRSGHDAGIAFMTGGSERYVFLDVDYGDGSDTYRIEAVGDGGRVATIGTVKVDEGRGAWAGDIPESLVGPDMVRVVGEDGEVFCWARFGPVAT